MAKLNRDYIKKFVSDIITEGKFDGCAYKWLDDDYAIVFACIPDTLQEHKGGKDYSLCGKIAYNTDDLQCDYDVDWYMPEVFGEVMDTELCDCQDMTVDGVVDFFVDTYNNMKEALPTAPTK